MFSYLDIYVRSLIVFCMENLVCTWSLKLHGLYYKFTVNVTSHWHLSLLPTEFNKYMSKIYIELCWFGKANRQVHFRVFLTVQPTAQQDYLQFIWLLKLKASVKTQKTTLRKFSALSQNWLNYESCRPLSILCLRHISLP